MPDHFDETDAVLARKLAEIPVPAGLRARITRAPAAPSEPAWWSRGVTAIAATVAVLLAVLALTARPPAGESVADARRDMAAFLSGPFDLPMATTDLRKITDWFQEMHDGAAIDLPAALATAVPKGCREIAWRGHRATLVCFNLPDGGVAHLVTFPSNAFADAPGGSPHIAKAGGWMEASWSRAGMTYLLFAPGSSEELLELI